MLAARLIVLLWAAGAAAVSCAHVNPDRAPCLQSCAKQKDTCMLSAADPAQIQQCDAQDSACVAACPT
jgi:hypothetical protein